MTNAVQGERIAIVTGGATGLGLACSKRLLASGYRVLALGKDVEEHIDDPHFSYRDFDVTDGAAISAVAAEHPALDALVNAAGIILHDGQEFTDQGFRRVMDVNVEGTRMMAYACRDALVARKGAIVNFASMWSIFGSARNPAYSTSKGAVLQLTRSLAAAWAAEGVRVNAVAPGWIKTRMSVRAMSDPQRNELLIRRIPAARWGEPDEVAAAACFLLSPEASYINGVMLPIDGGYGIA